MAVSKSLSGPTTPFSSHVTASNPHKAHPPGNIFRPLLVPAYSVTDTYLVLVYTTNTLAARYSSSARA
jgi:hypothetical protein